MGLRTNLSWFSLPIALAAALVGCSEHPAASGAGAGDEGPAAALTQPDPARAGNGSENSGVRAEDVAIAQSLSELLSTYSAPESLWSTVEATVENGRVTLRGAVPSEHQRIEIVERVSRLPGVTHVDDKLGLSDQR